MKKFCSLFSCLMFVVFAAGCSKDNKSSPTSFVTIYADGVAVNSLTLVSNQKVNLEAVLRDSAGNVVDGYTTAWSIDGSFGTFSSQTSNSTVFTAVDGSTVGTYSGIIADCNGIKKKIPASVQLFSISTPFSGSNTIPYGSTKNFTATATLAGLPYTGTVKWAVVPAGVGYFSSETTQTGEAVTYYAPASGSPKTIKIAVTVNGITVEVGGGIPFYLN